MPISLLSIQLVNTTTRYAQSRYPHERLARPPQSRVINCFFGCCQPGWTLIGAGLKPDDSMVRSMKSVIPPGVKHYAETVTSFHPENNFITTQGSRRLHYDFLVVAPGLQINLSGIDGLREALADPGSGVSTIYSLDGAKQTWKNIQALRGGNAIFTHPPGVVKCAGAPQKIMWCAKNQMKWKLLLTPSATKPQDGQIRMEKAEEAR